MTPLRQRMTEEMQVRNLSPRTQSSYVQQVSLFARHFHKSPELLGPEDWRCSRPLVSRSPRNTSRWGIHLTQVTPRCSMWLRGGLPARFA